MAYRRVILSQESHSNPWLVAGGASFYNDRPSAEARTEPVRRFRPVPVRRTPLEIAMSAPDRLAERCLHLLTVKDLPVGQVFVEPGQSLAAKTSKVADALQAVARDYAALCARPRLRVEAAVTTSVVVCTAGRPAELERCLRSLAVQSRRPDEVLVVDYGPSSRKAQAAAQAFGAIYLREVHPMLDHARNAGSRRATGDIVAYLDDDTRLDERWLDRLVDAFDEPEIEAVAGLVLPAEIETRTQWTFESRRGAERAFRRRDFQPGDYQRQKRWAFASWSIGSGCNMAFRRSVFERVGGFDVRLGAGAAGSAGAAEIWNRILHFGGSCRYEPTAVVYRAPPRDEEALKAYVRRRASGHAAALLVQYERTGEPGNLRRLVRSLVLRRLGRLIGGPGRSETASLAREELKGFLAGILFYARTARPKKRGRNLPAEGERGIVSASEAPGTGHAAHGRAPATTAGGNKTRSDHPRGFVPGSKTAPPPKPAPGFALDPGRYGIEAPLISVVIPAYNAERTLERTLTSVCAQTYERLEIIVVDDGSTDATAEIATEHAAEDPRIRLVRKANGGLAAARNTGIGHATGAFVAPVDADDLCHPEKYARLLKAILQAGPVCALAYGDSAVIDEADRILSVPEPRSRRLEGRVLRELLQSNFIGNGSSPLIRRDAVLEAGLYDPGLRAAGADGSEDLKLYLAIAERYDFASVAMPLTGYRLSAGSMSARIAPIIRSHWMVVEPYARRYPAYAKDVEQGQFDLVLWYVLRSLRAGHVRQAWAELKPQLRQGPGRTMKTLLSLLLRQRPTWSALRLFGARDGNGPSKTFPYGPDAASTSSRMG